MFKSKGVLVGVAAAVVGAALLLAGMSVSTTSGAGTDIGGAPNGFPSLTGNPPASPAESGGRVPPAVQPMPPIRRPGDGLGGAGAAFQRPRWGVASCQLEELP